MATVPISVRIDDEDKAKIDALIESNRYRSISDFIAIAVKDELASGRTGSEEWLRAQAARTVRDDMRDGRYDDLIEGRVKIILSRLVTQ